MTVHINYAQMLSPDPVVLRYGGLDREDHDQEL